MDIKGKFMFTCDWEQGEGRSNRGWLLMCTWFCEDAKNILKLDCDNACTALWINENHWIVYFK